MSKKDNPPWGSREYCTRWGSRKSLTIPTIDHCWLVTPLPHLNDNLSLSECKKNHLAASYYLKGECCCCHLIVFEATNWSQCVVNLLMWSFFFGVLLSGGNTGSTNRNWLYNMDKNCLHILYSLFTYMYIKELNLELSWYIMDECIDSIHD